MAEPQLTGSFVFRLDGEILGRLFMSRAGTFEILQASALQESFVVDSIEVQSESGRCRLTFSEWEEEDSPVGAKLWVSEYAIELTVDDLIAFGTYSASLNPEERASGALLEQIRRDAEEDFMLCAKLLGRSVRRDLVVDEETPDRPKSGDRFH